MFEVILRIIYSSKREHLSGVVIWTQQASCLKPQTFRTHFRSLDQKKKVKKATKVLKDRNKVDKVRRCVVVAALPSPSLTGSWSREAWPRVCGLQRPACCQDPSCENRTVVCAAQSAAARAFAKSAQLLLLLSATCCFRHGEDKGLCLCTTWSLVFYCSIHLMLELHLNTNLGGFFKLLLFKLNLTRNQILM